MKRVSFLCPTNATLMIKGGVRWVGSCSTYGEGRRTLTW